MVQKKHTTIAYLLWQALTNLAFKVVVRLSEVSALLAELSDFYTLWMLLSAIHLHHFTTDLNTYRLLYRLHYLPEHIFNSEPIRLGKTSTRV